MLKNNSKTDVAEQSKQGAPAEDAFANTRSYEKPRLEPLETWSSVTATMPPGGSF